MHGGGWVRGDRHAANIRALKEPLSQAGFGWFSISYRLVKNLFAFGAAVDDVQQAIVHLRDNAGRYGIDPGRIVVAASPQGRIWSRWQGFATLPWWPL